MALGGIPRARSGTAPVTTLGTLLRSAAKRPGSAPGTRTSKPLALLLPERTCDRTGS